jgi:two-component sensor histidine kinase
LTHNPREYWVTVEDDGVGLPSKIPASLGLEIVESLVHDDLKGKIKFKRGKRGTQVGIVMPRKNILDTD